jgi:hypothetical protein
MKNKRCYIKMFLTNKLIVKNCLYFLLKIVLLKFQKPDLLNLHSFIFKSYYQFRSSREFEFRKNRSVNSRDPLRAEITKDL